MVAVTACLSMAAVGTVKAVHLATDYTYRWSGEVLSFGTGLSWWFPQAAADFVEREGLPGQIFSGYSEGGYLAFRLGPKYKNYIDGRAIPFGKDLMQRANQLKSSGPDSPAWSMEAERYGINTMIVPIGRYVALQFFPVLKQFCASESWSPVYLDEVSAVFVRHTPETEALIGRLKVDCATAPLPRSAPAGNSAQAFNAWANAASVLKALGRNGEALAAIGKALDIFPESAYLHFTRGHIYEESGDLRAAEQDFLEATRLEPELVAPWSALGAYYQGGGRLPEAIAAWTQAAKVSRWAWEPLQSLGYAYLEAREPREALKAFDRAADSLPEHPELVVDEAYLANLAHGKARCWYRLGDLPQAISFEEEATRHLPGNSGLWQQLAALYAAAGRGEEAMKASARGSTAP
jgi:Flp pilus assembly protein TadD